MSPLLASRAMVELLKLVFSLVRSFCRPNAELILENLALRHQLQIALRSHPRPRLEQQTAIDFLGSPSSAYVSDEFAA